MPLIEVKDVVAGYGGAPILNGVNIAIEQSDIGVIVGPNGAGKSTTLKAIFGLLQGHRRDRSSSTGEEITNSLPDKLVPLGLSFVPQEKNVFTSMTRRGEPRDGRLHAARRFRRHAGLGLRHVPGARRRSAASRRASCRAGSARWWRWAAR